MAEILGAVASGAGLLSLSMQLLDSAQKLKGFYNLSKDAPDTVQQLSFDMETMAIALRQFERYRQNDVFGSELLTRCILACDQAVNKIKTAIEEMRRLLSKARFAGRMYMAFKEPEVRKLLEDMEHAKSSMLLAYTSYCQSWNMREAARNATAFATQGQRLDRLQASVESGNLALLGRITAFTPPHIVNGDASYQQKCLDDSRPLKLAHDKAKRGKGYKYRLEFPRWLTGCIWDFGLYHRNSVWTFQLNPVNVRPNHTYAFDFVRAGDVESVRELINSRQLSVQDCEEDEFGLRHNLLEMAAIHRCFDLCTFLLEESLFFHENAVFRKVLRTCAQCDSLDEEAYNFFLVEHNLEIELEHDDTNPGYDGLAGNLQLTAACFWVMLANQSVPFVNLPFSHRFSMIIHSIGWPAEVVLKLLHNENPTILATETDKDGKQALHWAAAHFGEWLRRCELAPCNPDGWEASEKAKSYGELASMLVAMGADVHAMWRVPTPFLHSFSAHRVGEPLDDPFLTFLRGVILRGVNIAWNGYWTWTRHTLAKAVKQWGEMLVAGSGSLATYVAAENRVIDSIQIECIDAGYDLIFNPASSWTFVPARLAITADSNLALHVRDVINISKWRKTPQQLPGKWPQIATWPAVISWQPDLNDHQEGFHWVLTGPNLVYSRSYCVDSGGTVDQPWYARGPCDGDYKDLFKQTQDDHGMVAGLLSHEWKRRLESSHDHTRRRTGSVPASMNRYKEGHGQEYLRTTIITPPRGSEYAIHKCLSDSHWGIRTLWHHFPDRSCLQGRCREATLDHAFSAYKYADWIFGWEDWLLHSKDHVQIAARFATRFLPHHTDILMRTSERATHRARLMMGPMRQEEAAM